jgi:hypothetical protein
VTAGLTLDAGALIALERRRARVMQLVLRATERRLPTTVPAPVLVEWWRGRSDLREKILAAVLVEPLHTALARSAGEALAAVAGATAIDAIVVASAALRGDTILTSDPEDLVRLADYFGGVRVLAV